MFIYHKIRTWQTYKTIHFHTHLHNNRGWPLLYLFHLTSFLDLDNSWKMLCQLLASSPFPE